jgi:hypothetical protein
MGKWPMFGKVISGFMVIATLTVQAPVFAVVTESAGNDGEKQSKRKNKLYSKGKMVLRLGACN